MNSINAQIGINSMAVLLLFPNLTYKDLLVNSYRVQHVYANYMYFKVYYTVYRFN